MAITYNKSLDLAIAPPSTSSSDQGGMDKKSQDPVRKTEGGKYGTTDEEHNANTMGLFDIDNSGIG